MNQEKLVLGQKENDQEFTQKLNILELNKVKIIKNHTGDREDNSLVIDEWDHWYPDSY